MTYDSNNIFAKIIRGDIPCDKVYEDDYVLAFHDISKAAPVHILVLPKGEYISFDDFVQQAGVEKVAHFFAAVQRVASQMGVVEAGYRLITNHGRDGSQSVPHFHVHLLGGTSLNGLLANDRVKR